MPQHLTLRVHLPPALARQLAISALLAASLVAAAGQPAAALPLSTPAPASRDPIFDSRHNMSATTLPDLKILWAGGISFDSEVPTASVVIYDPIAIQTKPAGSLTMARYDHSALQLTDGRILIVGGERPDRRPTALVEIYDASTRKSHRAGSLVTPRCSPSLTQLLDGQVLLAGGSRCPPYPEEKPVRSFEIYNVKTGRSRIVGQFGVMRYDPDATLLKDGRVLFTGGFDSEGKPVSENEIYDPATNKLTAASAMSAERSLESIALLPDGTVLFAGGLPSYTHTGHAYKSAEIFDPRTNQFRPVGEMNSARDCAGTVLLKDGRVLLAGGESGSVHMGGSENTAELYDPKSRTFSPTGGMTEARTCPAAKLLPDGTVLVQGGSLRGSPSGFEIGLRNSEIYDPVRGKFTRLPEAPGTTKQ